MDKYEIIEQIGQGQSSLVYKGRKRKTIEYVAIKKVDKAHKKKVVNEVKILNTMKHHNILKFYSWYETTKHYWIILEYCSGGDLLSLLMEDKKLPLTTIKFFAVDLVTALQAIHSKGFIYCDLKLSNILLDGTYGILKLSDFGIAQPIEKLTLEDIDINRGPKLDRGSPSYMAPELFLGGRYTVCSDFWSLGCVFYELASGKPPYVSDSIEEVIDMILRDPFVPLPDVTDEFNDLMRGLLQKDPAKRFTWEKLRNHAFFKGEKISEKVPKQPHYLSIPEVYKTHPFSMNNEPSSRIRESVAKNAKVNMEREIGPTYNGDNQNVARTIGDMEYNFVEETPTKSNSQEKQQLDDVPGSDSEASESDNTPRVSKPQKKLNLNQGTKISGINNQRIAPNKSEIAPQIPVNVLSDPIYDHGNPEPVTDLLFNQSDTYVKPIVQNERIEIAESTNFDASLLNFEPLSPEELLAMETNEQREEFLATVYRSIKRGKSKVKLNTLNYFEILCKNTRVANMLINSSFIRLFISMLSGKSSTSKLRVCSIMGLLMRHATLITKNAVGDAIFPALVNALEEDLPVRRKAIACLGELLFYVATQDGDQDDVWEIPTLVVSAIRKCIERKEDEVIQHYVVKTLENISAHSTEYAQKFAEGNTMSNLLYIFQHSSNDLLKTSAISTCSRLCRHKKMMAGQLFNWISPKVFPQLITDQNHIIVQSILNIVNLLFLHDESNHVVQILLENKKFLLNVQDLLSSSNSTIKGKAIITIHFMIKLSPKLLYYLCNQFQLQERIEDIAQRDHDIYVKRCLKLLIATLCESVEKLIKKICNDVNATKVSRSTQELTRGIQSEFQTILCLLRRTPSLRVRILSPSIVQNLSACLRLLANFSSVLTVSCLSTIELLSHQQAILQFSQHVLDHLLPILVTILNSSDRDLRFLSLKIVTDITLKFMNDTELYNIEAKTPSKETEKLNNIIVHSLLPKFSQLLSDQEQIPLYGLKLLNSIVDQNTGFITLLKETHFTVISQIVEFFSLNHQNNNVHNVFLLLKIIMSEVLDFKYLYDQNIVKHLTDILQYAYQNRIDSFFEPCLGIADFLLYRNSQMSKPTTTSPLHESTHTIELAKIMFQENALLGECMPIFVELSAHEDILIAEAASHVLLLLSRLYQQIHPEIMSKHGTILRALQHYKNNTDDSVCQFLLKMIFVILQHNPKAYRSEISNCTGVITELSGAANSSSRVAISLLELISQR